MFDVQDVSFCFCFSKLAMRRHLFAFAFDLTISFVCLSGSEFDDVPAWRAPMVGTKPMD